MLDLHITIYIYAYSVPENCNNFLTFTQKLLKAGLNESKRLNFEISCYRKLWLYTNARSLFG